tara:strand:- start:862 stop:1509 length:648 start_codon:yes stop_codon:yes gene_type:complete
MLIVSVGSDCATKKRVEEHHYKKSTVSHMFDWVLSDFDSVSQIFENSIINFDTFSSENFQIMTKTQENKYAISHKFLNFVSLHDASIELSENDAIKVVSDKYKRRLKRFIELIKNNDEIFFIGTFDNYNPIQYGNMEITNKSIERFFRMIHTFNPLNNHKLIIISNNTSNISITNPRLLVINSNDYITMKSFEIDWYRFFLDWDEIFKRVYSFAN